MEEVHKMALQLPQTLLSQVANFGQQPMQNLQQGLLTPVQVAAQQPAGIGALVSGLGGMFGIDTRSPAQLEQAQRRQQREYVQSGITSLGTEGEEIQRKLDLKMITPAQAQAQIEALKVKQAQTARLAAKTDAALLLQEAISSNQSAETLKKLEQEMIAAGASAAEIESAKDAGRQARNESETALTLSLRRDLLKAVNEGNQEEIARVLKTAQDKLPSFEFQKEYIAAKELKAKSARLITDENNTKFNQDIYNKLEENIGINAAKAYKAKPDNSKAYSDLQSDVEADIKRSEEAGKENLVTTEGVFNDIVNGAVQDIVADSSLTVKQKKAATALVSSSLSGLYAEVKDQKTVDDVKKIVKDALSNEDVQKAIKTGRKQIDIPWKIRNEPRVSGEIRKSLKGSTDSSGEWSLRSKRKG
jgi:hypothetical protein